MTFAYYLVYLYRVDFFSTSYGRIHKSLDREIYFTMAWVGYGGNHRKIFCYVEFCYGHRNRNRKITRLRIHSI